MAPRSAKRGVAARRTRQDASRPPVSPLHNDARPRPPRPPVLSLPLPDPGQRGVPLRPSSLVASRAAPSLLLRSKAIAPIRHGEAKPQVAPHRVLGAGERATCRAALPFPSVSALLRHAIRRYCPHPPCTSSEHLHAMVPALPSTPIGAPLRARTSQSMPPPHLPAPTLTRPHRPPLRAPLLFSGRPVAD
jgi:hypothetical protein